MTSSEDTSSGHPNEHERSVNMHERERINQALRAWWDDPDPTATLDYDSIWKRAARLWWEDISLEEQSQYRAKTRERCNCDDPGVEDIYLVFMGSYPTDNNNALLVHAYIAGTVPRALAHNRAHGLRHQIDDRIYNERHGIIPPHELTFIFENLDPVDAAALQAVSDVLARGHVFIATATWDLSNHLIYALTSGFANHAESRLSHDDACRLLYYEPHLYQEGFQRWLANIEHEPVASMDDDA